MINTKNDKRVKPATQNIDKPIGGKRELILSLVIQTMVYRYMGVRDNTSEGGWKLPYINLEGYDTNAPRFFDDERIEILFHGWKNYIRTKYGKDMNSVAMSALMQNQTRKAFRNKELYPLFNPEDEYHADVLERVVCKSFEALLEHSGTYDVRTKTYEVLYG